MGEVAKSCVECKKKCLCHMSLSLKKSEASHYQFLAQSHLTMSPVDLKRSSCFSVKILKTVVSLCQI